MKLLLLIIGIVLSNSSSAGSRTGYRFVFVDTSSKQTSEVTKLFADYFNSELPADIYRCAEKNRFIEFDYVYMQRRPRGITTQLVKAAANHDKQATENLRTTLRTFRNSEIDGGFDGLLVFSIDKNRVQLMIIGSIANGYQKTSSLHRQNELTSGDLKKLFCDSLADLEYSYGDK